MTVGSDEITKQADDVTKTPIGESPIGNHVEKIGNNNSDTKNVSSGSIKNNTKDSEPNVNGSKTDISDKLEADHLTNGESTQADDTKSVLANGGESISRGVSFEDDVSSEIVRIENDGDTDGRPSSKFGNLVRTVQVSYDL